MWIGLSLSLSAYATTQLIPLGFWTLKSDWSEGTVLANQNDLQTQDFSWQIISNKHFQTISAYLWKESLVYHKGQ